LIPFTRGAALGEAALGEASLGDASLANVEKAATSAANSVANTSSCHGAITSLYAGTASQAGDLNGKVGVPALSIAHTSPTYE
jgi:hypothetical protein